MRYNFEITSLKIMRSNIHDGKIVVKANYTFGGSIGGGTDFEIYGLDENVLKGLLKTAEDEIVKDVEKSLKARNS